jgi:acyl carrier protein
MFDCQAESNNSCSKPFFKAEITKNLLPIKVDSDDRMLLSGRNEGLMTEIEIIAKETTDNVRTFIIDNFLFGDESGLENETSFLDAGIIDSTGVLELISYLEDHFKIQIEDIEVIPENLDSIDQVVVFLKKKVGMEA